MIRPVLVMIATTAATAASAATGPFFSMGNTDFVVLLAFILFVAAIVYFRAPHFAARLLDGQIDRIRSRIEEAENLQAEARDMVLDLEKRKTEAVSQAENIVSQAREDARLAVESARESIDIAAERRLEAARMQIAAAEDAAVQNIRNEAIDVAINAAGDVIANSMDDSFRDSQIDRAIGDLDTNLR